MIKTTIIIQARSNSTRYKNKIFKKISNLSLIEWVIKRCKLSKADKIILATSNHTKDKRLTFFCKQEGIIFFSGDESNVLKRFYDAANFSKTNNIIRVCADNPFIDPKEINQLILSFKKTKGKFDYYFNHRNLNSNTFADGFGAEMFKVSLLKKIIKKKIKKTHKEHVTSYLWDNKNLFSFYPCKTFIQQKYHNIICDINNKFDYDKLRNFIKVKKINVKTSASKIASLISSYEIDYYLKDLFNLNRSLAGENNRKTLKYLKNIVPLSIKGIKSDTNIEGWTIPKEWTINKGHISIDGEKILDFKDNNLHVPSYSQSVNKLLSFKELLKKIHTHKIPKAIPYRTFYYKKDWGFCLSKENLNLLKNNLKNQKNKKIRVRIDAKFKKGKMNYGEILIPGRSKREILISTYICHPSMANDNLSGVILTSLLARFLFSKANLKWSYRLVFVPETIGAISYISKNKKVFNNINTGFNISCVGGKGMFSVKQSVDKDHYINDLVIEVLKKNKIKFKLFPFDINGSDERQYSYFGNKLNIISLHKDKYYDFKEYHTSLDNLNFVNGSQVFATFNLYRLILNKLENEDVYVSSNKFCEPMLSKFKLYPNIGGAINPILNQNKNLDNILWVLFYSNGIRTLSQIKKKINISESKLNKIIKKLKIEGLLQNV